MAKTRKAPKLPATAGDVLAAAVDAYESATFGTVAPTDDRWPLCRFGKAVRETFEGVPVSMPIGEMFLLLLIVAKRRGISPPQLVTAALEHASQHTQPAAEELDRLADDGNPHVVD